MKIVIAGAGDIGFHLAKLLAMEQQDIILIDINREVLDYVATHLDVITIKGDSSSVTVLNEAQVKNADLLLAVTTSEKNNLVTAILAKNWEPNKPLHESTVQNIYCHTQKIIFPSLELIL